MPHDQLHNIKMYFVLSKVGFILALFVETRIYHV